jgi:hypothetical protein
MKLKTVNKLMTRYEYTQYYVLDALRMSDHLEIEVKTPFGYLTPDVIKDLGQYNIEVECLSESERGNVYRVTRQIPVDDAIEE